MTRAESSRAWPKSWLAAAITCVIVSAGFVATPAAAAEAPAATPTSTETPSPTPEPTASTTPTPTPTPDPSPSATPPVEQDDAPETPDADAMIMAAPLLDPTRPVLPVSPIVPVMPTATRVASSSVLEQAIATSRAAFPIGSRVVVLASGTTFWDANTAAALAGHVNAPVLFLPPTTVPLSVANELWRLGPSTIVIVGAPNTVSDAVAAQLRVFTPDVRRVDGGSDFATSRLALSMLPTDVGTVYLAGSGYATGGVSLVDIPLAAAAASGSAAGALLVNGVVAAADADTIAAMRRVGATNVVIVGTGDSVSASYEQSLVTAGFAVRRSGAASPDERAMQVAGLRTTAAQRLFVAHTGVMTDIMVAAISGAATRQPIGFAFYACVPNSTASYVGSQGARVVAVGDTSWLAPPVEANGSCATEKPKRDAMLDQAIRNIAAQFGGTYNVSVRELSGARETFGFNADVRVEPASMMKLYAAWAALAHVDVGLATYYTMMPGGLYLIDCLAVMIHASDNECHNDIVQWIGAPGINGMIANAGFSGTAYGNVGSGSVLYAGNRTTTADLTRMVERLRDGSLLSRASSDLLLSLMGAQIWKSRIASGIPWGVAQQSKPGSLWLPSGLLQADTGILYGSRSVVALSIVATGGVDREALRAITRTVYSHYNGGFGAAASYPPEQMVSKYATHMRSGPAGPVIGVIPGNMLLEVTDANRMWYKVRWGGGLVWVDFRTLRDRW